MDNRRALSCGGMSPPTGLLVAQVIIIAMIIHLGRGTTGEREPTTQLSARDDDDDDDPGLATTEAY